MFGIYRNIAVIGILTATTWSCTSTVDQGSASAMLEMTASDSAPVSQITDFASAEAYARSNGYVTGDCQNHIQGGELVAYSASYGGGEAGQANGHATKIGDRVWFVQEEMPTTQIMFAPGLGDMSGQSRWDLRRWSKLLCAVAFGKGLAGPRYDAVRGETVSSVVGGTAGGEVRYQDALKLTFHRTTNGGESTLIIVFAKGQGPRIMEFRESNQPDGTAKVYVGQSSNSGSLPTTASTNPGRNPG